MQNGASSVNTLIIVSSLMASAANLRIPSDSFSTPMRSSLCSQRKAFSSMWTFSRSQALAVGTKQTSSVQASDSQFVAIWSQIYFTLAMMRTLLSHLSLRLQVFDNDRVKNDKKWTKTCYSLTCMIIWVGITLQVYKSLVDDGGMVAVVALCWHPSQVALIREANIMFWGQQYEKM